MEHQEGREYVEHAARGNGKLTQFKQRIMNRIQRRREGYVNPHTGPTIMGRTGRPAHLVQWRTTSDQDLVLRALRLGLVRTGIGRAPWGPGGQFRTRKALFVAVTRAEAADVQPTPEGEQAAKAVAVRWAEESQGAHRAQG